MPTPSKTHLPVKQFIADSQILDNDGAEDDTDPALMRLPAPALRGTFAKAYELLCRLVSEIGWDELLKSRSAVFVMEEEYRNQKAQIIADTLESDLRGNGVVHEDGTVHPSMVDAIATAKRAPDGNDDDASTRGMSSPPPQSELGGAQKDEIKDEEEEDEEPHTAQAEGTVNGTKRSEFSASRGGIDKPKRAAASEADEDEEPERRREVSGEAHALNSKRLCERWLDNMFMCLYEVRILCI